MNIYDIWQVYDHGHDEYSFYDSREKVLKFLESQKEAFALSGRHGQVEHPNLYDYDDEIYLAFYDPQETPTEPVITASLIEIN